MSAAPPGTVEMSASASDSSTATATANYDPDTQDLLDPFITTTGDTQLTFVVTLDDGVTTYTWTVPPGSSIAAADLASLGVTNYAQVGDISFNAA